jgi:chromosome segregation ATPase
VSDSPADNVEVRLTVLEREVARLREQVTLTATDAGAARVLAGGADRDVSEVRAELRAHTQALNALRETQLEQGQQLREQREEIRELRYDLAGLDQRVAGGFATLGEGMAQIHTVLSRLASEE